MSTVLEAVREQQRGAAGVTGRAPPPRGRNWQAPWRLIALVALALLGVGILLVLVRQPEARRAESEGVPAGEPHVLAAPPAAPAALIAPKQPVPPAPPAVHSAVTDDLPRGRVADKAPVWTKPIALPKPKRVLREKPRQETAAKGSYPRSLPGRDGVQINSIRYSGNPSKRTVTLSIGTETASLHEGESLRGVEVQLILPDMVYVRDGGSVSALAGPD